MDTVSSEAEEEDDEALALLLDPDAAAEPLCAGKGNIRRGASGAGKTISDGNKRDGNRRALRSSPE